MARREVPTRATLLTACTTWTLAHVVVHTYRGGLVETDVHGLAGEPAADEIHYEVLCDPAQPLRPGQQRVLLTEPPRQLTLGFLVEFGCLQQIRELVGEVLVDQLQLGDAILVEQRDGGAVLNGVAEVIDADVVTELLAGQLLADDQRRSGEPRRLDGRSGRRRGP
jgi:hypothetical protein